MKKNSLRDVIYYIIAVVCATAFFVHEFIPSDSQEYLSVVNTHGQLKKQRKDALEAVKQQAVGSKLFNDYLVKKNLTDGAWERVVMVQEEQKFLGFKTFQHFLGEFGWALGLFIYALFNIVATFLRNEKKWPGEIALHGTLLFISLYFIAWCFKTEDFAKYQYVLSAVFMSIFILIATHRLVNFKKAYLNKLNANNVILLRNIRKATRFIVLEVRKKWVPKEKDVDYSKDLLDFNNSLDPLE